MTLKGCFYSDLFKENECFNRNGPYNRDDFLFFLIRLKELFSVYGVDLATSDINDPHESDFIIFNETPKGVLGISPNTPGYLLYLESHLVNKDNANVALHRRFEKVFTWNDQLVDGEKYIKVNYAFDLKGNVPGKNIKIGLCCMVSGNKKSSKKNELYSERIKVIRWFESNHLLDFDLYGTGWNKIGAGDSVISKAVGRLPRLINRYNSYRGLVDNKKDVISKYKFCFCFENSFGDQGYITEKIFDCIFSGAVPIYYGAENVSEYIDDNVFIDYRDFRSLEELYSFLNNMSDAEYSRYLENGRSYLRSEKSFLFDADVFSKTIIDNIIRDF